MSKNLEFQFIVLLVCGNGRPYGATAAAGRHGPLVQRGLSFCRKNGKMTGGLSFFTIPPALRASEAIEQNAKLEFIAQFTIENVGEALCLPAVKCHEFAGRLGEFVTMCRRDGKPVPYIKISNCPIN